MCEEKFTKAELSACLDYCYSSPCSIAVLENIKFYVSGNCNMVVNYIAQHTEYSSKEIRETLDILIEKGLIIITGEGIAGRETYELTELGEKIIAYYIEDALHLYDELLSEAEEY